MRAHARVRATHQRPPSSALLEKEAVSRTARVNVGSRDCPGVVYARGEGALVRVFARTGSLECGYGATGGAHEAVAHVLGADAVPRDGSRRIDAYGVGALAIAGAPGGSAYETVMREARVHVISRDGSRRVDAPGQGSLYVARACAGGIERGDCAIGGAHEAVIHIPRVYVVSRDSSGAVHALGEGSLRLGSARTRGIERCEGTAGRAHESVSGNVRIDIVSSEISPGVDAQRVCSLGWGGWASACVRRGEWREGTIACAHQAEGQKNGGALFRVYVVQIISRKRPRRIDGRCVGTDGVVSAWRNKIRYGAIGSAHESIYVKW